MGENYLSQYSHQRSHSPSNSSVGSFESASSRPGRRTIYIDVTKSPWGEALTKISSQTVDGYSINRFLEEIEPAEEPAEDTDLQSDALFDSSSWEPLPFKDLPHLYQYICNYSILHAQCCDFGLSKDDVDTLIRDDLAGDNFGKWVWFLDGVDRYSLAAEFDLASWADSLLRFGEDSMRPSREGKPPAILAVECGSHRVLAQLLQKSESCLMARDRKGWTVLHHAAASPSTALLSTIWENTTNYHDAINVHNYDGVTPLHVASFQSSAVVVRNLIDHGAAVMRVDRQGNNALHFACMRDRLHAEVVVALIKSGTAQWQRNKRGHTAPDRLKEKHKDSKSIFDSIVDSMSSDDIINSGDLKLLDSFVACSLSPKYWPEITGRLQKKLLLPLKQ